MRLAINHLTRMQPGNMCVAGIDLDTGRHVRPVWGSNLRTKNLVRHGGVFDIACVVELGWTQFCGERPHVEDHRFNPEDARVVETLPAAQFWQLLERHAFSTLTEIFGPELTPRGGRACGIDRGRGRISLGCLRLSGEAFLYVGRRAGKPHKVRLAFSDGCFDVDVGVTDIRLYGPDHVTPDVELVKRTAERLKNAGHVILSVGLTRAFTSSDDSPPLHWLQVNNLHFADEPCWQLG
ncbi:MAG: hypothetical protein KY476_11955 [Planctomycetes bacterium]|nr:hypothetical protein [Planctomycetota bacterium]